MKILMNLILGIFNNCSLNIGNTNFKTLTVKNLDDLKVEEVLNNIRKNLD